MAYQVTAVVRRCESASENNHLGLIIIENNLDWKADHNLFLLMIFTDLSDCSLIQVPDAVYHLMRHTELKSCDLSGNVITKISPKFAIKFNLITGEEK
jgi:hypothetical protein